MEEVLYKYIIKKKVLDIPGVGNISIYRVPAMYNIVDKKIAAPFFTTRFSEKFTKPEREFYQWLSAEMDISETEAIKQFNDFAYNAKNTLVDKKLVKLGNLGNLRYDSIIEQVVMDAERMEPLCLQPVYAERVVRSQMVNKVLVGESEMSVDQINEFYNRRSAKKDIGWITALVISILAAILMGLHFLNNGINISAAGNQNKLHITDSR